MMVLLLTSSQFQVLAGLINTLCRVSLLAGFTRKKVLTLTLTLGLTIITTQTLILLEANPYYYPKLSQINKKIRGKKWRWGLWLLGGGWIMPIRAENILFSGKSMLFCANVHLNFGQKCCSSPSWR